MISNEDIDAMKPDPNIERMSVRLDDIEVEFKLPAPSNPNQRPYRIEALAGSMEWFTADELLNWQKRMNMAIKLVMERTGG